MHPGKYFSGSRGADRPFLPSPHVALGTAIDVPFLRPARMQIAEVLQTLHYTNDYQSASRGFDGLFADYHRGESFVLLVSMDMTNV